jgi:CheY-like chemotaxis protein
MNRKVVSKFLKRDDYFSDEAEDGLEASRMVRENVAKFERNEIRKPYAILMDYMMPLCNGPTVTKNKRVGVYMSIFGLTGNDLEQTATFATMNKCIHILIFH